MGYSPWSKALDTTEQLNTCTHYCSFINLLKICQNILLYLLENYFKSLISTSLSLSLSLSLYIYVCVCVRAYIYTHNCSIVVLIFLYSKQQFWVVIVNSV